MIRINSRGKLITIKRSHCFMEIDPALMSLLYDELTMISNKQITSSSTTTTTADPAPNFPLGSGEDFKDSNKYNLSKFEYDLYHEEDDVSEKVVRVKRVSMPNKGEKWKVMQDNKVTFTVESNKISKKEREYLQTIDGFNFILARAKTGIKSLNSFRTELKKAIAIAESPKPSKILVTDKKPAKKKKK